MVGKGANLFNYLAEKGLGRKSLSKKGSERLVFNWSDDELEKFCTELNQLVLTDDRPVSSPFEFIATSTLSGGPYPCAHIGCRLNKVGSLSQFAALYAKKVLIPNPFDSLLKTRRYLDRLEVFNNIAILYELSPLIRSDIVGFSRSEYYHFCDDCYRKFMQVNKGPYGKQYNKVYDYIESRYLNDVSYNLSFDEKFNEVIIEEKGPTELIEHTIISTIQEPTKYLLSKSKNKPGKLSRSSVMRTKCHADHIRWIMGDLIRQEYYSKKFGHSYLTQREVDFAAINSYSSDSKTALISNAFSHHVPIIPNATIGALVKLRQLEAPAFEVYQDALEKAVTAAKGLDTRKSIQQAFDDLVRPEISKINKAMKNSKKVLLKSISDDLIISGGFIGFSLFGGVLPSNIATIVSALGGAHYGREVGKKILNLFRPPEEVQKNDYFFYWRAQQVLEKR